MILFVQPFGNYCLYTSLGQRLDEILNNNSNSAVYKQTVHEVCWVNILCFKEGNIWNKSLISNYLLLLNKKTNLSLLLNIKLRTSHVAKTLTLPSISTSPCSIEGK